MTNKLSLIRQRLELLWQEVERLEREGGGGGGDDSYTKAQTDALLATKVDKVQGSSLMTTAQANKLEGIESGAEVNVQANWNEDDTTSDAYILNKPTIPDITNYYTKNETNAEIQGAITDLDVPATSVTGHYIKSIGQADGKIEAVAELLDIAPAPSSTKPITSGGVYTALGDKADKSTTYTKTEVDIKVGGYTAESDNGSFSSLLHSAATYCGVDDTKEVNGFVVFTSSVTSENLIGFFNFKYLRNVAFSQVISNTITYNTQSQYGTITITGGTGPYKAVVKFI